MQIGCTKNLLDTIDMKGAELIEENDLFCWSANLLTIKRRKAVVVVNDSNRFGFVLYGLKAKDFSQLKTLIENGIWRCLAHENIKEEVIQKYLQQAQDLVITKTRGRAAVARLNKACERVDLLADWADPSAIYQTDLTRLLNSDLYKPNKVVDYVHPYELLIEDFKNRYGEKIISLAAVDLMIKLDLGTIWASRRLFVPLGITFEELHKIIQIAFDWRGIHMHDFNLLDEQGQSIINIISKFGEDYKPLLECLIVRDNEIWIDDYVKKGLKIIYTYDFGDQWNHDITVLDIVSDYDKNYPICIMAEGNRPPEDVGGIPGYENYQEVINNPEHPSYEDTQKWVESQWYRDFDMALTNRRLRHVLKR